MAEVSRRDGELGLLNFDLDSTLGLDGNVNV